MTAFAPLKRLLDPARPLTYGIVQAGEHVSDGIPYIRPIDMVGSRGVPDPSLLRRTSPEIARSYKRSTIKEGDVVVSIGPSYGKVMLVPHELSGANLTQGTARLAPSEKVAARFLFWTLQSHVCREYWDAAVAGATFPALNLGPLGNTPIPISSKVDQVNIADFLDRETAEADALIAKYERLIELLEEKRVALIAQAVTKGLDPNVPMKDSGVPWVGEIPSHWSTRRLWHFTPDDRQIMYGIVLPGPNVEDGVLIVKGGDVKAGRLNPSSLNRTTFEIEAGYKRSRLKGGDLVYAIRGGIGDVEIVPDSITGANITQDAARISLRRGISARWMRFTLESRPVFAQLQSAATGATIRGINIWSLKRAVIPTPPSEEQLAIARFLDLKISEINSLGGKANAAIALVREHRSALITAAVTGQIDVDRYDSRRQRVEVPV